jgi:hypothetical protein
VKLILELPASPGLRQGYWWGVKKTNPLTKSEQDNLAQVTDTVLTNKVCPSGLHLKTLSDRCLLRVEQYVTWTSGGGRKGYIVTILTGEHRDRTTSPLTWVQDDQTPSQIYDGRSVEVMRQLGLLTPNDVRSGPSLRPVTLKSEPEWLDSSKHILDVVF